MNEPAGRAQPTPPLGAARGTLWPAPPPPARPGPEWWTRSIEGLPGVGRATLERTAALGLDTVGGLLEHLPARYEAYDAARPVADLADGEEATVRVRVDSVRVRPTRRRRLRIVEARVADATGALTALWFNQEYLARTLTGGDTLMLRGRVEGGRPRRMVVRAHEVVDAGRSPGLHTEGLVPVYPASEALTPRRLRELVDLARPLVRARPEILPAWIRGRLHLPGAADALVALHFPRERAEAAQGRRRMVVEELLVLQLGLAAVRRREAVRRRAPALRPTGARTEALLAALPFALTAEQRRVAAEIARDLARPRPMRRLLQGEVGSGKTVVAALAICQAAEAGAQAALLVPTETLAEQHLRTLDALLAPAGLAPVLLTGKVPRAERERRLMALRTRTAPVAVGTQALLSEGVDFDRLALVVVDEQHRFGVEQRQALAERAGARGGEGSAAHLLYMTATPIPRTLALTAYGDLKVSTIRGRPPGRTPVETRWVREDGREAAYEAVRSEIRRGRQAYVICPLVEGGEEAEARAAVEEAERLRTGPFAGLRVGLAHGAQRTEEKRAAMADFAAGRTAVLVATTVVEVGIDVPNATVMIVEGAERFGLAQLHQLRGRVGRGTEPGLCLLFGDPVTEEGARRLEAVTQTADGFRLAELDLEIRGEGSILGVRQAGATDLRFARLARDRRPLAEARQVARRALREDPRLERPEHALLRAAVLARFRELPRLLEA
jgi:ATP-dependent DNA helicase RecG